MIDPWRLDHPDLSDDLRPPAQRGADRRKDPDGSLKKSAFAIIASVSDCALVPNPQVAEYAPDIGRQQQHLSLIGQTPPTVKLRRDILQLI
ncbi:MAG: hypothetical protein ABI575_08215 [Oxalobacteraceae bacterium]